MATKTQILNRALTFVGAAPVTSIDDNTTNANVLSRVYDDALKSVLSECEWNFAVTRGNLSVVVVTLPYYEPGRTVVYQKPTDMIRIFATNPSNAQWREEGDYIISDSTGLGVRYVYFEETTSRYPSFFVDALTDKLASEIAYQIVNSRSLGVEFVEKYEDISLPKAMAANSQTGDQQCMVDDAWENAKLNDINVDA
jgi:hypothetical protein